MDQPPVDQLSSRQRKLAALIADRLLRAPGIVARRAERVERRWRLGRRALVAVEAMKRGPATETELGRRSHPMLVDQAAVIGRFTIEGGEGMPHFIAHVSGPPSSKRVLIDSGDFETAHEAEDAAKSRWPNGDYFVVEAADRDQAASAAIAESRALD